MDGRHVDYGYDACNSGVNEEEKSQDIAAGGCNCTERHRRRVLHSYINTSSLPDVMNIRVRIGNR